MKKKCVAGKVKTFPQALAESLVCNRFFSKKRTELNFCPLQRGQKARMGEIDLPECIPGIAYSNIPSGVGRNSTLYALWRKSDYRQGTRRGLWKGFHLHRHTLLFHSYIGLSNVEKSL